VQVQQRTDVNLRVRAIQLKIHDEMEHRYLSEVLARPALEVLQVILADAMIRAAGAEPRSGEALLQSLLLIEHGLAVHEDINMLAGQEDERFRQLGVLAGDYYSSKYYRLLAQAGDIHMIGRFAEAIQDINEAKAELEREPGDFSLSGERYLELQERIHGRLLHTLRIRLLADQPYWDEIVSMLVRSSVLQKELHKESTRVWTRTWSNLRVWQQAGHEERKWLKQMQMGRRADHRLLSLHVKYGTSSDLYRQLEESLCLAREAIRMIPSLGDDLHELCDSLSEYQPLTQRACEEG